MATKTGISESKILNWANKADLMRISGVGPQYSELLEASGVDTIAELAHRNPENLAKAVTEVNREKHLSGSAPSPGMVVDWIDQAKHLSPRITY